MVTEEVDPTLTSPRLRMSSETRIAKAIEIAVQYGGIDGAHHKTWVIDQMVRALAGKDEDPTEFASIDWSAMSYEQIVATAKEGEDGPETYEWDEGIAP